MTVQPDHERGDWLDHVADRDRSLAKEITERRREANIAWFRGQAADRNGATRWYVVAHRGDGPTLADAMDADSVRAWCPMRKVVKRIGRRRGVATRTIPLFDGYLLVELLEGWEPSWLGVTTFDAVIGLLGDEGRPVPLPASTVEKLMEFEGLSAVEQGVMFARGKRVYITTGVFKGLEGRVVRSEDRHGELALELDLFGQMTPCRMGIDSVRLCD